MQTLTKILAPLAVTLATLAANPVWAETRLITVTGEGIVAAVPDLAYVNLGVSQQADRKSVV